MVEGNSRVGTRAGMAWPTTAGTSELGYVLAEGQHRMVHDHVGAAVGRGLQGREHGGRTPPHRLAEPHHVPQPVKTATASPTWLMSRSSRMNGTS